MKYHALIYYFLLCVVYNIYPNESWQLIKIDSEWGDYYYKNPSDNQCGAAITVNIERYDNIYQALECMKAGHKHIYLGDLLSLTPDLELQIKAMELKQIILADSDFILYTKGNERNALLLQKQQLEFRNAIKNNFDPMHIINNNYLLGKLLNYDEDDIKYFYKRMAVLEPLMAKMGDRAMLPYAQWTLPEQEQFDALVSENREWLLRYETNKQHAQEWLASNEPYTLEQLKSQNAALAAALEESSPEHQIKKNISEPVPGNQKKESWWRLLFNKIYQFFS